MIHGAVMPRQPRLRIVGDLLVDEVTGGAEVTPGPVVGRLPQVGRRVRVVRFVGLLRVEPGASQITIEQSRRDCVGRQRRSGAGPDPVLTAAWVVGRVDDSSRSDLR